MSTRPADPNPPDLDLLNPVLQDLRLVRASYCRTDMTAPWGVQIPPSGDIRTWAQRVTRRYDLLSAAWREL